MQTWFRNEIDAYLNGLILNDRYDRQGFPYEVIDELLFLSDLRWAMSHDERVPVISDRDGDDFTCQSRGPVIARSRVESAVGGATGGEESYRPPHLPMQKARESRRSLVYQAFSDWSR